MSHPAWRGVRHRHCSWCDTSSIAQLFEKGLHTMGMLRNRRSRKSKPVVDVADDEVKLTWSEKYSRLRGRLKDPQWLRYGKLLLAGKFMGLAVVAAIVLGGPRPLRMS